ncbi:MAG: GTP diphosphokinase [candidate division WS6 bacterium GW2011_GWD1_35_594]|uniref:GTP diphosphokinase n=1 Tax=candidate division WS6 bacterium GW2011_GWB1_33_6 TaxID=1619088 RepID=A0A0G0CUF2_9BACT|nr:MAG: GTP diphosphokinase [candidate division WS6 bacterium GW2011_GWB1_33_6]KKP54924.1 MAG: GTP pyrophosphokinase, GTP pyrophosphokinase [candidate division WS6 bacterium GW2011_WS6_33_547]KKP56753.1 MAG: GTP diphosphokinase [candidate division WS6 bacterium GW2011_GWF2_33_92]KKP82118.1 MAG: GTP diphosphokinase [candidate division WS6 bacterium GW2011_GWD1_35_594]
MNTEQLKKNLIESSPKSFISLISKAIDLAERYHSNQNRLSGEPYVNHPLRTAITLAQMGLETNTIIAGLLHNSITNAPWLKEQIEKDISENFDTDILSLINSCNNINKATASSDTEYEIITKFILNSSKDLRPVLIKLADTLDNVRTIEYMPAERLGSKIQKVFNIYGPLAEYLNLDQIKKELEERALQIYRPEEYTQIKEKLELNNFTEEVKYKYVEYLKGILTDISPAPTVYGRVKSIHSIYNKQKKQLKEGGRIEISNLRDLLAFRVITDSTDNCFKVLEKIMDSGEILTEEFDDYITHPKPNGYKALQGPVVLPSVTNNIIELQIITHDMYYYNTYGPASHIAYKESKSRYAKPTDKYNWVEQVHNEIDSHIARREQEQSIPIRVDIFPSNIYAFTPKGKIIQLDINDTVVDFAFRVHTDIGNSMVSAKVNSKAVKLDYKVQTGDIVEIKTQMGKTSVKQDWLIHANSTTTQAKIQRAWKK